MPAKKNIGSNEAPKGRSKPAKKTAAKKRAAAEASLLSAKESAMGASMKTVGNVRRSNAHMCNPPCKPGYECQQVYEEGRFIWKCVKVDVIGD